VKDEKALMASLEARIRALALKAYGEHFMAQTGYPVRCGGSTLGSGWDERAALLRAIERSIRALCLHAHLQGYTQGHAATQDGGGEEG
jgi:hypothetical protein